MTDPETPRDETPRFTPGPWKYSLIDDGEVSGVEFVFKLGPKDGPGWQSQRIFRYEAPSEEESPDQFAEAEANAHLIAAAPDLYAALVDLRAMIIGEHGLSAYENVNGERADAALQKAKGAK